VLLAPGKSKLFRPVESGMSLANTERRYGIAAIALHWLLAVLITALVVMGIYMVRLPDVGFSTTKIILVLIHKEIGMVVLGLAVVRLAWRLWNVLPRLVETLPEWQKVTAIFVHLCFYALMLALPITGWLMSSAAGIPVSVLNLVTLPDFLPHDEFLFERLRLIHDWLGYAIALLICLHAGAALGHHFVLRDETLRKMLWSRRAQNS
jgi:cytochrome b561